MIVLVFDTETTGLPPVNTPITKVNNMLQKWPYIIQFSYILYDTEEYKIIGSYDYIVKLPEDVKMAEDVVKIHGITNEMSAAQGVDIMFVLSQFVNACNSVDLIVAHNASFDLQMIQVQMERASDFIKYADFYSTIKTKIYCTMQESLDLCGLVRVDRYGNKYNKFPKLSELHEKIFGLIPSHLHNSFHDVIVCLRCFYKLYFDTDLMELDPELKLISQPLDMC